MDSGEEGLLHGDAQLFFDGSFERCRILIFERGNRQSGVLATLRISVATLTFLQIRLALCSSYAWFSKSLYTWLSCAEQAIYLPGEFIGLVMKKYETIVSLSAKEGKDGSPLIAL